MEKYDYFLLRVPVNMTYRQLCSFHLFHVMPKLCERAMEALQTHIERVATALWHQRESAAAMKNVLGKVSGFTVTMFGCKSLVFNYRSSQLLELVSRPHGAKINFKDSQLPRAVLKILYC